MHELIAEHEYARKTVGGLETAEQTYIISDTDFTKDISKLLETLARFYTAHIEKEDRRFFPPSMEYFSEQELERMLQEFSDFDRKMIHVKYQQIVERMEHEQGLG